MFKTGDLAQYLPDGQIAFLGRLDEQIKIRGFRIEPNEIVAALNEHPAISQSIVIARELASGDRELVAYFVAVTQVLPVLSELRDFLNARLPDHMVPPKFVVLEALPLTPNGKVDRLALPAPDDANTLRDEDFREPRTEVEKLVAGVLAPLLGVERVDVEANFFSLGGHSLLGIQLISRLRACLGIELSLRSVFEAPSVAELSVEVEQLLRARVEAMTDEEALRTLESRRIVQEMRMSDVSSTSPNPSRARKPDPPLSLAALLDPEVLANPYPLYHRLRAESPVHWDPLLRVWVATRYDDVVRVLRDFSAERTPTPEQLTAMGIPALNPVAQVMVKQMLFLDPPSHTRIRGLAFRRIHTSPRGGVADAYPGHCEEHLLEPVAVAGRMDLIADLAEPLPCIVTAEMLGVPVEDHRQLKSWSRDFAEILGNFQHNPDRIQRIVKCTEEMTAYFRSAMRSDNLQPRRAGQFVAGTRKSHGDRLTEDEIDRELHYHDGRRTGNHHEPDRQRRAGAATQTQINWQGSAPTRH